MKIIVYLARRYLLAKWSLMSTLSILMISFGVITLIVVLSIMNGFHDTFKRKILETHTYHIIVQPYGDENYSLSNIKKILAENKDIISIVPYFDGECIIKSRTAARGIAVKALPGDVLDIDSGFKKEIKVTQGVFDLRGKNSILLGAELAKEIGAAIGDYVSILTFRTGEFPSLSAFRIFRVEGFIKTGYWEYDRNMGYVSLDSAYELFGIGPDELSIGVKLRKIDRVDAVALWMRKNGLSNASILTWRDVNRVLFEALQNEKVAIGFIVLLIIVSGAFNIIGSLVMTIMNKQKEIGILRAVGATPSMITRVFIVDGFFMGIIGSAIGIITGYFLTLHIETIFSIFESILNGARALFYMLFMAPAGMQPPAPFEILSDSIYYLEGVPVDIRYTDVMVISACAVLISIFAAYYPAKKASSIKPVETIRYE